MKAVGESMKFPLLYYHNNIIGAVNLINVSVWLVIGKNIRIEEIYRKIVS